MKRSKGRICLSAFLAVVELVFGYVEWRYVSYTQALRKAQEQYVLPHHVLVNTLNLKLYTAPELLHLAP